MLIAFSGKTRWKICVASSCSKLPRKWTRCSVVHLFLYSSTILKVIVTLKHQPGFEFLQKDGSVLKKRYKAVYFQNVVDSYKKFSKQEKGYNVRYIAIPGGGITKAVYFPIVLTEVIYFRLTKSFISSFHFISLPFSVKKSYSKKHCRLQIYFTYILHLKKVKGLLKWVFHKPFSIIFLYRSLIRGFYHYRLVKIDSKHYRLEW